MSEGKKIHYFRRVKDGMQIPVYEDLVEEHKKMRDPATKDRMFIYEGPAGNKETTTYKEPPIVERDENQCVICGFKAKNANGLRLHSKTHAKD